MGDDKRKRLQWYVSSMQLADELLAAAYPSLDARTRLEFALRIACAEGVAAETFDLTCAVDRIDCGGE